MVTTLERELQRPRPMHEREISEWVSPHASATFSYDGVRLRYLIHHPPGLGPFPLVLYLHGAGERGSALELVKRHGIPREIEAGRDLGCIAVSPQCPNGWYWTQLTDVLQAFVDELLVSQPVDDRRVYLTGMSMGGYGAWRLAAEAPERFAAVVPICGGGDPAWAPRLRELPIWVFHGSDDPVVPASESERMVRSLQHLGAPVRFTLYAGVGHDSWTRTYEDPALLEWLARQRRS